MDCKLNSGELISISIASGNILRVTRGCVWITRSGDSRDYLIGPGGQLQLGLHDAVVLEALVDAAFTLGMDQVHGAVPLSLGIRMAFIEQRS